MNWSSNYYGNKAASTPRHIESVTLYTPILTSVRTLNMNLIYKNKATILMNEYMSIYVRARKYTDTYEFTHLNQTSSSLVDFGGEQLVIGKTKAITTLQTNVYIHPFNSI